MELTDFTEAFIRKRSAKDALTAARNIVKNEHVYAAIRRGDTVSGDVEDDNSIMSAVSIVLGASDVVKVACDHHPEISKWCEHIAALALVCGSNTGSVSIRPTLAEMISGLEAESLRGLLGKLVERDAELIGKIEAILSTPADKLALPDVTAFRKALKRDLRVAEAEAVGGQRLSSYELTKALAPALAGVYIPALKQVDTYLDAGEGLNALALLDVIADILTQNFGDLRYAYDESGSILAGLNERWAQAILAADPHGRERAKWRKKLDDHAEEFEEYGHEESLGTAYEATTEGWNDPEIKAVLRGETVDMADAIKNDASTYRSYGGHAANLDELRLRILEQQGRLEEYVRLALFAGYGAKAAIMLVRLGRLDEAEKHTAERVRSSNHRLLVAKALSASGAEQAALRIAASGLEFGGDRYGLGLWLREHATAAGDVALAQRAAIVAVTSKPDLAQWDWLRESTGGSWESVRNDIIAQLKKTQTHLNDDLLDIMLAENEYEWAASLIESHSETAVRAADAILPVRPDLIPPISRKNADGIVDNSHTHLYEAAAAWLEHAKRAYAALGQTDEWVTLRQAFLTNYNRKYKFTSLLKAL